jgi:homocysteine S-methyltransferase
VDSIGLTNVVSRLNHGVDIGGERLARQTAYHIGVAVNPTALNLDDEIRRFEFKVEAGAEFAITQVVFDLDAFDAFMKRVAHLRVPIIAGLWPFDSQLNAEFLANELPGVSVPEEYLRRMRAVAPGEAAAAEGVAIAREMAAAVKDRVQGVQLSNATGRIHIALQVLDALA